jgi:hypothetical protein
MLRSWERGAEVFEQLLLDHEPSLVSSDVDLRTVQSPVQRMRVV